MWKAEAEAEAAAAHGNFRDDTGSTLCICFIFVVGMQSGVTHEEAEDERKKQQIDEQFMAFCVNMKNENTIESESNKHRNGIKNCTKQ